MRSLVVLFALVAVAVAAPSASVEKRSVGLVDVVGYSVPAAVSHQSRVDVHSSPAVVASAPVEYVAQPVVAVRTVDAPVVYTGASAVSHQSRVDVRNSPTVIATAPVVSAAPVVAQQVLEPTVVEARSVYAPVGTVYAGGSAVTHQSRVDVESSPAVVSEQIVGAAPAVVAARSLYAPSVYAPSVYAPSVYASSVYTPYASYW